MKKYQEKDTLIFHTLDNGIGVKPQFHEHIFSLSNKLDA